jgi:hypothetical protein
MAKAPLEIRSLARKYTHKALNTLVSIMVEPKAPAAARIMAANALLDRGWGKAAQLVDVQGEVRQLIEVKLNVVQAAPARVIDATCEPSAPPAIASQASHALPSEQPLELVAKEIKDLDQQFTSLRGAGDAGDPK